MNFFQIHFYKYAIGHRSAQLMKYPHTHTHTHILYIIYIFTNLISTSIHGIEKTKKPGQEQEIKVPRITAQGKKKKVFWVKKKKKRT